MLNFSALVKAPEWRVEMKKKRCLNENQNARTIQVYVIAPNADEAMREAIRKNPAFFAVSVRKP